MRIYQVTPFRPSHFGAISPPWFQREFCSRVTADYLANLAAEPSETLWIGGRPMAIAGVLGACELWSLVDERIVSHRKTLLSVAREFIGKFGWLYANVDGQYHEACNFLEHLGFERTGAHRAGEQVRIRYERRLPCPHH